MTGRLQQVRALATAAGGVGLWLWLVLSGAIGCGTGLSVDPPGATSTPPDSGAVAFDITVPEDVQIAEVSLRWICAHDERVHRVLVTATTTEAVFHGLPVGDCHADLRASSRDARSCSAERDFQVFKNTTTHVPVALSCSPPKKDAPTGQARFMLQFATYDCSQDRIAIASAIPGRIAVGAISTVSAVAWVDAVIGSTSWAFSTDDATAGSGRATLSPSTACPDGSCVQAQCTAPGTVRIIATLEDAQCVDQAEVWLDCLGSASHSDAGPDAPITDAAITDAAITDAALPADAAFPIDSGNQ